MKKIMIIVLAAFLLPHVVYAKKENLIPNDSKIFVVPMDNGMDRFIVAEIIQQKSPVSIVLDEKAADYIITGTALKKEGSNKWYHYLSGTAGTTDSVQSSLSLIDKKNQTLVWADNAGDRSFFWGTLKRGGERKAALRIVRKFNKSIFPIKSSK